jgi:hypothetical protein
MSRFGLAALGLVIAAAAGFFAGRSVAKDGDETVYELRTYVAHEGKLQDLHARFRNHTVKLFQRHGIVSVAYWVPTDEPASKDTLIYVVKHKSPEAAKESWKAFIADPEWKKVFAESHVNGPLVKKVESVYMKATDYSALQP